MIIELKVCSLYKFKVGCKVDEIAIAACIFNNIRLSYNGTALKNDTTSKLSSYFYLFCFVWRFSAVSKEVLPDKIPSQAFDCYGLLCSAVQMLYSKELRTDGWAEENIQSYMISSGLTPLRRKNLMAWDFVRKIRNIQLMFQMKLNVIPVLITTRASYMNVLFSVISDRNTIPKGWKKHSLTVSA